MKRERNSEDVLLVPNAFPLYVRGCGELIDFDNPTHPSLRSWIMEADNCDDLNSYLSRRLSKDKHEYKVHQRTIVRGKLNTLFLIEKEGLRCLASLKDLHLYVQFRDWYIVRQLRSVPFSISRRRRCSRVQVRIPDIVVLLTKQVCKDGGFEDMSRLVLDHVEEHYWKQLHRALLAVVLEEVQEAACRRATW